jgi:hypothetical protein
MTNEKDITNRIINETATCTSILSRDAFNIGEMVDTIRENCNADTDRTKEQIDHGKGYRNLLIHNMHNQLRDMTRQLQTIGDNISIIRKRMDYDEAEVDRLFDSEDEDKDEEDEDKCDDGMTILPSR